MLKRICVVGGGIAGLTVAHELRALAGQARVDAEVRVLEATLRAGGRIQTTPDQGYLVEGGPQALLAGRENTRRLIADLELAGSITVAAPAAKRRYIYRDGALHALPLTPGELARFKLVSPKGLLRALAEPFAARTLSGDPSVREFAVNHAGEEAADIVVDALVNGIHAGDPARLSMKSAFPRLAEFVGPDRSVLTAAVKRLVQRPSGQGGAGAAPVAGVPARGLFSFAGGLQTLVARLRERLGSGVATGTEVRALRRQGALWQIEVPRGEAADAVIIAAPSYAAAPILQAAHPELAEELRQIEFAPVAAVSLGYERGAVSHPLDGLGFLVPGNQRPRMLGALFISALFPDRQPPGKAHIRVMMGGARDGEAARMGDRDLQNVVHSELREILHIYGEPEFVQIQRWPRALPMYNVGHAARLERIGHALEGLPGLYLTGFSYRGVGVNDCVDDAFKTAKQAFEDLFPGRTG